MSNFMMHFISTGTKFPYAYYIGVMSALKNHKGKVKLWYLEEPDSKYFRILQNDTRLEMEKTDFLSYGSSSEILKDMDDNLRYVTMFDYLAWKIVSEQSGIIVGLDSITLADWQDLLEDDKEMLVPRDSEEVPNSFTMHGVIVRKGSKLAKQIFKDIRGVIHDGKELDGKHKAFKNGKLVFGGAGIIPYLNRVYENMDKVSVADVGVLGGINKDHKTKGFYLYQHKDIGKFLSKDVRTIPLYASSSKNFKTLTEDYVRNSDTLLSELIKKVLPITHTTKPEHYRFHILGLVHLPTSEEYMACAFTQKNVKLCKMLLEMGHEVWLYGAENSTAPCTKFVETHKLTDIRKAWGDGDNRFEIGYDWHRGQFRHDINDKKKPVTMQYYAHAINTINKFKKPDDFLVLTQGMYQKPIADATKLYLTVESGIGYRGSFAMFRSWESSYIQNFTYGSENPRQSINGRYYDRIIPNYFDEKDFPFSNKAKDYYLFMGRMIQRKGVMTAIKATQASGEKLILAGQLSNELSLEKINSYPHVEYIGYADVKKRAELMGGAIATFCPSEYLEPFCGVHAESMLCGTPVITTNFGAFTDYVINGVNGYRCDTLNDFVEATEKVKSIDRNGVRTSANQFTMGEVSKLYQKWFDDLYGVWESTGQGGNKPHGWNYIKPKN